MLSYKQLTSCDSLVIQAKALDKCTMGKMDDLCPKIHATFCLLRHLEITELQKNLYYWLCPIGRKANKNISCQFRFIKLSNKRKTCPNHWLNTNNFSQSAKIAMLYFTPTVSSQYWKNLPNFTKLSKFNFLCQEAFIRLAKIMDLVPGSFLVVFTSFEKNWS